VEERGSAKRELEEDQICKVVLWLRRSNEGVVNLLYREGEGEREEERTDLL
jgi:hypothetical protein